MYDKKPVPNCTQCHGAGHLPRETCTTCDGQETVVRNCDDCDDCDGRGHGGRNYKAHESGYRVCQTCQGLGTRGRMQCNECWGIDDGQRRV